MLQPDKVQPKSSFPGGFQLKLSYAFLLQNIS